MFYSDYGNTIISCQDSCFQNKPLQSYIFEQNNVRFFIKKKQINICHKCKKNGPIYNKLVHFNLTVSVYYC